jgi:hypothetical protein
MKMIRYFSPDGTRYSLWGALVLELLLGPFSHVHADSKVSFRDGIQPVRRTLTVPIDRVDHISIKICYHEFGYCPLRLRILVTDECFHS